MAKYYVRIVAVFLIFSAFFTRVNAQSIVINEISQGTGFAEYVEFVVTAPPSCDPTDYCVDLRSYLIDDNNGEFASGTGTGIAVGVVRFSNNSMWSCVPAGTIILIYNDDEPNASLPADDISLSDGNCVLIIPISSSLFESNVTSPTISDPSYPFSGWTSGGDWTLISMANSNDSFQILESTATNILFSVSWGNNDNNTLIYYAGSASGLVYYNNGNDPFNLSNWITGPIPASETPGSANSPANATWISSMNNNCTPALSIDTTSSNANCGSACDGTAAVIANDGVAPYQYSWSSGQITPSITGLCAGNYDVTVTDNNGCTQTSSFVIQSGSPVILPVNILCTQNANTILQASVSGGIWAGTGIINSATGEFSPAIAAQGIHTIEYYINTSGCIDTATTIIQVLDNIQITSTDVQLCENEGLYTLNATPSGGLWSGNGLVDITNGIVDLDLLNPGEHQFTYAFSQTCGDTAVIQMEVRADIPIILNLDDSMCTNDGVIDLPSPYSGGIWLGNGVSGGTTYQFTPQFAGIGMHTLYYINTSLCELGDSISVEVFDNPISVISVDELSGCAPLRIEMSQSNPSLKGVAWYINENLVSNTSEAQYTFNTGGLYTVSAIITAFNGCQQNTILSSRIEVLDQPKAAFRPVRIDGTFQYEFICTTDEIVLHSWVLNGQPSTEEKPRYDFKNIGEYPVCLYVENKFTCSDTICEIFEVTNPFFQVYIPNTFTPNEDDANEVFLPVITDDQIRDYTFTIFNRWGDPIFITKDLYKGWNGQYLSQNASEGVYAWTLEFTPPKTNTPFYKTGHVLLLR